MQRVEHSIRVAAPLSEVYSAWRDFERFPEFMEHVEEVRSTGKMSHWKLKAPMGINIEYDAEISEDEPNHSIGWRSVDGNLGTSGNVTFTPLGDNETQVHVILQWFDPPAGAIGEALSRILQNPDQMLEEDLARFKQMLESGMRRVA